MLTPHGHECLVRLAGWMPFEKAAEMLEDFMGIHASRIVSQKYTEEAGQAYEQIQSEEVERLEKETPFVEQGGGQNSNQCRWCDGAAITWCLGRSENLGDWRSATCGGRAG